MCVSVPSTRGGTGGVDNENALAQAQNPAIERARRTALPIRSLVLAVNVC